MYGYRRIITIILFQSALLLFISSFNTRAEEVTQGEDKLIKGEITFVSGKVVYINVTSADNIKPDMTFEVFEKIDVRSEGDPLGKDLNKIGELKIAKIGERLSVGIITSPGTEGKIRIGNKIIQKK